MRVILLAGSVIASTSIKLLAEQADPSSWSLNTASNVIQVILLAIVAMFVKSGLDRAVNRLDTMDHDLQEAKEDYAYLIGKLNIEPRPRKK